MGFKAVIFDLDGTLLDSLEDLADSMNQVLESLGFAPHPVPAYKYFVGEGMEVLARRVLPEAVRDEDTLARTVAAMRQVYGQRWDHKTRPYAGVPELLEALRARGLRRAVLSNKPDDFTRLTVERLLAPHAFDLVQGVGPGTPPKPDPTGALAVAARLGVEPAACLYLGDTATDMQTACRAGMYAVGALWGFRTREELEENGARAVVERPAEVLALLQVLV
ncbi:MAG: HAD family hydrolase [Candidatus Latescibacteria bacterium]|nr:HAD family hydrolase [Candidatus Latescibacterota bacterium]